MTATGLFDLLASDAIKAPDGRDVASHLSLFAEKLIAASLANLDYLRQYEQSLGANRPSDPDLDLRISRSIWELYKEWATDAEEVLDRAKSIGTGRVKDADKLDDAIGRVLARLSVTPEQIARARQQVQEGQFVPAKELRDELNARLRA